MKPQLSRNLQTRTVPALLLLIGCALGLEGATVESNLNKTFPAAPGGRLVLDADRGPIEIITSDRSDILVEVKRSVSRVPAEQAAELFAAHLVTFEQDGGEVAVRAKIKEGFRQVSRAAQNFRVEFRVLTPKRFNFDLRTAAGDITANDIDGKVKARTAGGSLKFASVTGALDANTSAGGIRVADAGGPVTASTSGGNIHIEGVNAGGKVETSAGSITVNRAKVKLTAHTSGGNIQAGELDCPAELDTSAGSITVKSARGPLKANTSGGHVTIEEAQDTVIADTSAGGITATFASQPTGDCRLTTAGGSISVKLDSELAFNVDAKTAGGQVSTELPITMTVTGQVRQEGLKGKLNGGGKALVLRTSAGNITLRKK